MKRDNSFLKRLTVLFFCMLMLQGLVFAGTTGKIAGVVKDAETGEVLTGAVVYLDGQNYGATTDVDGYYFILNVPPGSYTLVAEILGYGKVQLQGLRVKIDQTTQQDFKLSSKAIEGQEVNVVADQPLIQKDVTASVATIGAEEIAALPVDDFDQLVAIQAGVVDGHFRGGRLGEVAYLVDGIPVNDPYNNSRGIEVENSSIQQLEVISGTFNAEYGQALSAIVNLVTREGGTDYELNVSSFAGTFLTSNSDIFPNLDKVDGAGVRSVDASISGPIPMFGDKMRFFATGRYVKNDGYLYGIRTFNTTDGYDPAIGILFNTGDSSFVSMNNFEERSFHSKLTYYITPSLKLNMGVLWSDNFNRYYDHSYRFVPDGIKDNFRDNANFNLVLNHGFSTSGFYTFRAARNISNYQGYLYEDPLDPRYVIPEQGQANGVNSFRTGGNQNDRYDRTTTTDVAKLDLRTQFTKEHFIGMGVEFKQHEIDQFYTAFNSNNIAGGEGIIYPAEYSIGWENFVKKPIEISAYLQDKIEYQDFIMNIGLRYDYFDPNTNVPADLKDPNLDFLGQNNLRKIDPKQQISPRMSVAFPISADGVIHVAYGHFFQIPNFEFLYGGISDSAGVTRFIIDLGADLNGPRGNPDLEPQRTTTYEIGIKQGLNDIIAVELTGYYRDIRNLVDTEIIETYNGAQYARFINRDYGNVRGVILGLDKRFTNYWGGRIEYTYQYAEGNASDPRSVFFDNQSDPPREPEKQLTPLDWDQRSTLNFSLNAGKPGNFTVGAIGRMGSGTPYTADLTYIAAQVNFRNNRKKPLTYQLDLRAEKQFNIANTRVTAYCLAFNVLDALNENWVYGSTGEADRDLNAIRNQGEIIGYNSIEDFVLNPTAYRSPREIRLGFSFGL
ncbi:MAG: TonB-dependent receptor [Calditrichia bacterium]